MPAARDGVTGPATPTDAVQNAVSNAVRDAVRLAPRRYPMPPLPQDARAAADCDADTALAFCIEAARLAAHDGRPAPPGTFSLFARSLATIIRSSMDEDAGDPAFRALVLHAHDAEVREHVRLAATAHADRRLVRSSVDALAHPGKLAALAPGTARDALARLHQLAQAGDWSALRLHAQQQGLAVLAESEALARLERAAALAATSGVTRFLALRSGMGPLAGSAFATAQGRASARTGDFAEQQALAAFEQIAMLLQAPFGAGAFRASRGIRVPPAFPGDAQKAKDEWDAALLRVDAPSAAILLLAEVKASPAAATPDFTRLHRGLLRLAQADAGSDYIFACDGGHVPIAGASLRQLAPHGRDLPAHVIYCCTARSEAKPAPLAAAAKAVLLAERGSLAYAQHMIRGETPPESMLQEVWSSLATEPRLRAALHQYDTARVVRERMLHPDDLVAAFRDVVAG